MISEVLRSAIDQQINRELYSSYLYMAAASHLASENFPGMASWMQTQADEEMVHARKFIKFVEDRDATVSFDAIDKPHADFTTPLSAFESALEHERLITRHINDLYTLALEQSDYACQGLLQWFINEQVEEEAMVTEVVEKLRRAGDNGAALLMLDRQLSARDADGSE
ncbi:MAG: ferritin [Dehalococcoidia bacterium]